VAMVATGVGAWFAFSQGLKRLALAAQPSVGTSVRRNWRWGVGIVLAAAPPNGQVMSAAYVVPYTVVGIVAGSLLLILPTFRQIVRAIPETWLVGIHAVRVLGVLFLALLDMKLLPAEFALPAGYGDITVGLLSLVAIYALVTRKPYARGLGIGWNLLGLLDFVGALTTGIAFIGPHAAQVGAAGISPLYLNYVFLIPSFGVPVFALLHFYSIYQMATRGADTAENRVKAAQTAAA
jgi:hypothetical protein